MSDTSQSRVARDLLSLTSAPVADLLAELDAASTGAHDQAGMPPRANQLAGIIVAEIVRLIRLGTRRELADAAAGMSRATVGAKRTRLAERFPEALRLLDAAAIALAAAAAPSSNGGELAVLRSWNGKALDVVRLVSEASDHAVARSTLRSTLGVEESYLSHLLGDLESAGLVERIRNGREVSVHLGPTAQAEHVIGALAQSAAAARRIDEESIKYVLEQAVLGEMPSDDLVTPEAAESLQQLAVRVSRFRQEAAAADVSIRELLVGGGMTIATVRVAGRTLRGPKPLEPISNEVLWSMELHQGRLHQIASWGTCGDWLGLAERTDRKALGETPVAFVGVRQRSQGSMVMTRYTLPDEAFEPPAYLPKPGYMAAGTIATGYVQYGEDPEFAQTASSRNAIPVGRILANTATPAAVHAVQDDEIQSTE